jgi:hypothetical protein
VRAYPAWRDVFERDLRDGAERLELKQKSRNFANHIDATQIKKNSLNQARFCDVGGMSAKCPTRYENGAAAPILPAFFVIQSGAIEHSGRCRASPARRRPEPPAVGAIRFKGGVCEKPAPPI